MKPFPLALISCTGLGLVSMAIARPTIGFHGTCIFNGVSEACFVREDTESIEVTYASDNKRVIYRKPASGEISVESDGKVFPATWKVDDRRGVTIFRTQNGLTTIPHRKPKTSR